MVGKVAERASDVVPAAPAARHVWSGHCVPIEQVGNRSRPEEVVAFGDGVDCPGERTCCPAPEPGIGPEDGADQFGRVDERDVGAYPESFCQGSVYGSGLEDST